MKNKIIQTIFLGLFVIMVIYALSLKEHWENYNEAIDNGLPKTAITHLDTILAITKRTQNYNEYMTALINKIVLEANVQGNKPEFKIAMLQKEMPHVPTKIKPMLEVILAQWYWQYFQRNKYRFMKRSQTEELIEEDFTTWDLPKLFGRIDSLYQNLLKKEELLGNIPIENFKDFLLPGNTPLEYRPTLYDFVAHEALKFYTCAEQVAAYPEDMFGINASSPAFSPIRDFIEYQPITNDTASAKYKALRIYQKLMAFHYTHRNIDALIDLDIHRLSYIKNVSYGDEIDELYIIRLQELMKMYPNTPQYSLVAFSLAEAWCDLDSLRKGYDIAQLGYEKYPESYGGQACQAKMVQLMQKSVAIQCEQCIPPRTTPMVVKYRNFTNLYFRIYRDEWHRFMHKPYASPNEIDTTILREMVKQKPLLCWNEVLPETPDLEIHSKIVDIPELLPGYYRIIASCDEDFLTSRFVSQAWFWVSNQTLVIRSFYNLVDGLVLDAITGEPVPRITIKEITRGQDDIYDFRRTTQTDKQGYFKFNYKNKKLNRYSLHLLEGNGDTLLHSSMICPGRYFPTQPERLVFFFKDRSLYRPGQTVYFKGICVLIDQEHNDYEVIPKKEVTVIFTDVNGQLIDSLQVKTNDFGSFSGQFITPEDRLTGAMRIFTNDPRGSISIRVEEYKRPKFTVEFEPLIKAFQVNDTVQVTGKAETYSGAPVDNAAVRFRVVRSASFPSWHGWCYPYYGYKSRSICIAHGTTQTRDDGTFTVLFAAKPDLRIPSSHDPRFQYQVFADVISPDGETQSGKNIIAIGYTSLDMQFLCTEKPQDNTSFTVQIVSQTLNGEKFPATGILQVYRLQQPDSPISDGMLGAQIDSVKNKFSSDWTTWPLDTIVDEYPFSTTVDNPHIFKLILPAGFYKLKGIAHDTYDNEIQTWLPLIVLPDWDNKHFSLELPFFVEIENSTVHVGQKLRMVWGSGYETARCLIEIEHEKKIIKRYWTKKGQTQHTFSFPVTDKYRGGFRVHFTQVRENRIYRKFQTVDVPWDNKELIVETKTFRDKLLPGESEELTLTITGKTTQLKKAEVVAGMYDYSLDQYCKHNWPSFNFFKRFQPALSFSFINQCHGFRLWRYQNWNKEYDYPPKRTFIQFPDRIKRDFLYYQFPKDIKYEVVKLEDNRIIPASEGKSFEGDYGKIIGQVVCAETGEPLICADVIVEGTQLGAECDGKGQFMIENVPEGTWRVVASYISYQPFTYTQVMVKQGHITYLTFRLEPVTIEVSAITCVAERPDIVVSQTSTGRTGTVLSQTIEGLAVASEPEESAIGLSEEELATIKVRRNFNETAFFFPHLTTKRDGTVQIEYTMPEALTKWKFMAFAHGKKCENGSLTEYTVTQKDIMVQANPPRFLREHDIVSFNAKVINMCDTVQKGIVQIDFHDAVADTPVTNGFGVANYARNFTVEPHTSKTYSWVLTVPRFTHPISYTVVAKSQSLSDGETDVIPVLSSRIYLTETMPLNVRGEQSKQFTFNRLQEIDSSATLEPHRFTVQIVSNPSWYAIQALPFLMEFPYECAEQIFNRYYANMLAGYIMQTDTAIRNVIDSWKGTDALQSNLEKNQQLKSVLLEETPWVRQAKNETEAKQNIAFLFDMDTLIKYKNSALKKLSDMQNSDGSWPWFPGGKPNPYITLYIATGLGRLRAMKVSADMEIAFSAISYLDWWIHDHYLKVTQSNLPEYMSPFIAFFLYGRSFFLSDKPLSQDTKDAVDYFLDKAEEHWLDLNSRLSQGYLALALYRFGRTEAAQKIMASIKERSVWDEEMGMFWREDERSWWWYRAPIETQALMIEAFYVVMNDSSAVEECKVWLLKQKQTQHWRTTKATADVVYALLCRGVDWLSSDELVDVKLGEMTITPEKVEAGTNFYEKIYLEDEIKPEFSSITITKHDPGVAWGGAYFQYFEDMSAVTAHETNLKLEKTIFVKEHTQKGEIISPLSGSLHVGDLITNRIILRVDRDMEFVHMKDLRGSGLEPVDVLSGYKYQDGLRYYQSTKDVATHFFIDYLPKGTYVFEYDLRVQLIGKYQSGVAEIQCMYAPEFTSHSESILLEVE